MSNDTCKHGNVVYREGDCEKCEIEDAAEAELGRRQNEEDQIRAEQWFADNEPAAWYGDYDDIYGGGYSEM